MARYRSNTQVDPPGPFVLVSVGRPRSVEADGELFPAQLDTAADLTAVPWSTIARLALTPVDEYPVLGFGGEPQEYPRYLVEFSIQGANRRVIAPVLATTNEQYILLGRDILNQFHATLDGPNGVLMIE